MQVHSKLRASNREALWGGAQRLWMATTAAGKQLHAMQHAPHFANSNTALNANCIEQTGG
jgi:hypothetical protein